jgi:hypothetical protein
VDVTCISWWDGMEEAVVAIVQDEPSGRDSLSNAAAFSRLMSWLTSLADGLLERGILLVSRCLICAICIAGLDGLDLIHPVRPARPGR